MLQFELSKHAEEQIELRGISRRIIFDVLQNPDKIEAEGYGQYVYQKSVLFDMTIYLVRVFVNSNKIPNLIKTAYRTSNFSKYE